MFVKLYMFCKNKCVKATPNQIQRRYAKKRGNAITSTFKYRVQLFYKIKCCYLYRVVIDNDSVTEIDYRHRENGIPGK